MIAIRTQPGIGGDERFQLGPGLQVDPARNSVIRDGVMRTVEPRVMELLVYLSSRPGQLVTKRELMDEVWRTNVVDEAVQRAVSLLRSALADSAQDPMIIETVPRRGYRLLVHPSGIARAGGKARLTWLMAGAAAAALLVLAILAVARPEPPAPSAQPPGQPEGRLEAEEPPHSEATPGPTSSRRRPEAESPVPSEQPVPPGRDPTPMPDSMLAPPAPPAPPPAGVETPSAREAPPAPVPSPDADRQAASTSATSSTRASSSRK